MTLRPRQSQWLRCRKRLWITLGTLHAQLLHGLQLWTLNGLKMSVTNCNFAHGPVLVCVVWDVTHIALFLQSLSVWLRFGKHDLALDIPISWVDLTGTSSFPVLDVKDTVDYLIRSNNLPKLFGDQPVEGIQDTLLEFWRRYRVEWPDFGVYDASLQSKVCLARCIPVFIHGDEGRGFKRSGVMILSVQGALGRGTRPFQLKHPLQSVRSIKMGINLKGSSFNSRLLFTAMPKKYYSSNPESWFLNMSISVLFIFSPWFDLILMPANKPAPSNPQVPILRRIFRSCWASWSMTYFASKKVSNFMGKSGT